MTEKSPTGRLSSSVIKKARELINRKNETFNLFDGYAQIPPYHKVAHKVRTFETYLLNFLTPEKITDAELEAWMKESPFETPQADTAVDLFLEEIEIVDEDFDLNPLHLGEGVRRSAEIEQEELGEDEVDSYYDFGFDIREHCKKLGVKIPNDRDLGRYDSGVEWL